MLNRQRAAAANVPLVSATKKAAHLERGLLAVKNR
jgi:hypothetical protein